MAKFNSIWGDLTVGNITEKEDTTDARKVDPKPADTKDDDTIQTGAAGVTTEEEEDVEEGEKVIPKVEKDKDGEEVVEGEEQEELVFEDAEIEKAYNLLVDEGVLPEPLEGDEGFDISPAGLADAVAAVTRKKLEEEIASIPDSVQQYYAHVMEGKDPSSFKLQTPTVWEDLNLEGEPNQELALTQFYINQGMTVEEAKEEIEDVKTAGKLAKKADVARESLVKVQEANSTARKEKADAAKATQQKEVDDDINALKKTIDDSDTIAGFELNDKKRKEFKEYLFKVKPRTGKTQMQENMSSEDRRMNIAFLDFVDYTKADLKKEVTTDMTKKRKKQLTRYSDKGVRGSNSSKSVTTKTDVNKGKIVFPTIFGNQSVEVED